MRKIISVNDMKYDFFISGTIGVRYDWWTGQRGTTADDVREFLDKHKDEELNIAVSSLGGYIDDGLQICELIASHGKCNMYIIGMTASAATVLCMKAKSVKIAEGSLMLIHNSSQMLDVWTSANKEKIDEIISSFKKIQEDLNTIDRAIASLYSHRNGKTIEDNMSKMSEEKWMLAEDAVAFGIVDEVLDDEDSKQQAKNVRNAFSSKKGITAHYAAPTLPKNSDRKSLWKKLRDNLSSMQEIMDDVSEQSGNSIADETPKTIQTNSQKTMKKLVLNLVCALLGVQDLTCSETGQVTMSENDLNSIENEMKRLTDEIQAAKDAKATAEAAAKRAKEDLDKLQKAFDDFKEEAGDTTKHNVNDEVDRPTARQMYDTVKNLI